MKKTLPYQLLAYLQQEGGLVASGTLQRIEWPKINVWGNRVGTHTPRSVVRRLEEMAATGEISVEYKGNHAFYSATKKEETYPKQIYIGPKVFEVKNQEEEEKVRVIQAQGRTLEPMSANSN